MAYIKIIKIKVFNLNLGNHTHIIQVTVNLIYSYLKKLVGKFFLPSFLARVIIKFLQSSKLG